MNSNSQTDSINEILNSEEMSEKLAEIETDALQSMSYSQMGVLNKINKMLFFREKLLTNQIKLENESAYIELNVSNSTNNINNNNKEKKKKKLQLNLHYYIYYYIYYYLFTF